MWKLTQLARTLAQKPVRPVSIFLPQNASGDGWIGQFSVVKNRFLGSSLQPIRNVDVYPIQSRNFSYAIINQGWWIWILMVGWFQSIFY